MLSEQTITELRKLEAYLLEEPKRFNLSYWGIHIDPKEASRDIDELYWDLNEYLAINAIKDTILPVLPPCGTVACLAGNICVMKGIVTPEVHGNVSVYYFAEDTSDKAAEVLGINRFEADRLFLPWHVPTTNKWPYEFQMRLDAQKPGTKEYAQVAVDRIEHFILTGE